MGTIKNAVQNKGDPMEKLGTVAGFLGILVCITAVIGRFVGTPLVFHLKAPAVLLAGGCLLLAGIFLRSFKK